jgi:F-type H+-transporting ATPase subunit a
VAEESGKIDPMHQFLVEPMFGRNWTIAGESIAFTNSAMWMGVALLALWAFMLGGMKRELVPGRWQAAVEGFTGFITSMMDQNVGPAGRKYVPYVFSLFMFILAANLLGMLPVALCRRASVHGDEPFDRHRRACAAELQPGADHRLRQAWLPLLQPVRAAWRQGLHGGGAVPDRADQLPDAAVQPCAATVRCNDRGHILMKVLAGFVINGLNAEALWVAPVVAIPSFILMIGITVLELLVCAIQAYVFALLTSLYLNDAINLH